MASVSTLSNKVATLDYVKMISMEISEGFFQIKDRLELTHIITTESLPRFSRREELHTRKSSVTLHVLNMAELTTRSVTIT